MKNWKKIIIGLIVAYFLFGTAYLLLTTDWYSSSCPEDICGPPDGCYPGVFGC